jgi:uncharacterized integral membrane protein (TIGR00698 family)
MRLTKQLGAAVASTWPGILFALAVAGLGKWLAAAASRFVAGLAGLDASGADAQSLVSGISLAVVLGLVCRNVAGVPPVFRPGLIWAARTGLRAGIVLLGLKLALATAGQISLLAVPVAALCIATALFVVARVSRRVGLPPRLGALIAVGTSVCGVTAIAATGPAISADEDETSYAIACITLFGLLALFIYPWVAHAAFGSSQVLAGVFLGTSIHDTSQVAGAGLVYQETFGAPLTLQAATVTKLIRNISMAVLIPVVAIRFRTGDRRLTARDVRAAVPGFVLVFLGAVLLRSVGDVAVGSVPGPAGHTLVGGWRAILGAASQTSAWALAAALAAVGLNTDLSRLRRLGLQPLLVGLIAALTVGVVSLVALTIARHSLGAGDWGLGTGERQESRITPCPMPHAPCPMPHAPCPKPRAPSPMPHAPCGFGVAGCARAAHMTCHARISGAFSYALPWHSPCVWEGAPGRGGPT